MMKKNFILAVFCIIISAMAFAQVPHTISYQAVVRAGTGELIREKQIAMRVAIIQGDMYGESVYNEMHYPSTNENGCVVVEIGGGETDGDFSGIDWAQGPYFMKVEIDPNGGDNYSIEAINQMLAVPYSFYAERAGNVPDVSNFITDETDPTVPAWAKAETKPEYDYGEIQNTPEQQVLSISNDTIFLTNGGFVKLPAATVGFSGDYNDLTNRPEIPTVPTAVSAFENDANYLTSYTETQTIADVAALGNSVNAQLKDVTNPTQNQDAATKKYVDDLIAALQAQNAALQLAINTLHVGVTNGHAWVDLGLPSGTKWATCNVGGTNPEDMGDYFAWGETTAKDDYTWESYRYAEGTSLSDPRLTKYCDNAEYGNDEYTDELTILEPSDDAATANWGNGWRMPTQTEMQELVDNCDRTWTMQNGINGMLFTSRSNGNTIFLPAAGNYNDVGLGFVGNAGLYWSNSLYPNEPFYSRHLEFSSDDCYPNYAFRYEGFPVRAVYRP